MSERQGLIAYCKQLLAELIERGVNVDEWNQYIYKMRDIDINTYYDDGYASVSVYNVDPDGCTITDDSFYYINSDGQEVWNDL